MRLRSSGLFCQRENHDSIAGKRTGWQIEEAKARGVARIIGRH
jgi:hypothetical protein